MTGHWAAAALVHYPVYRAGSGHSSNEGTKRQHNVALLAAALGLVGPGKFNYGNGKLGPNSNACVLH